MLPLLLSLHLLGPAPAQARLELVPRSPPRLTVRDLELQATGDPRPRPHLDEAVAGAGVLLGADLLAASAYLLAPSRSVQLGAVALVAAASPAAATALEWAVAGPHAGSFGRALLYGYLLRAGELVGAALVFGVLAPQLSADHRSELGTLTGLGLLATEGVILPITLSTGLHGLGPLHETRWDAAPTP
jgi:hypothetical protein